MDRGWISKKQPIRLGKTKIEQNKRKYTIISKNSLTKGCFLFVHRVLTFCVYVISLSVEVNHAGIRNRARNLFEPQGALGDSEATRAQASCAPDAPTPAPSRWDVESHEWREPRFSALAGRRVSNFIEPEPFF